MMLTAGAPVASQTAAVSSWQQCRHGNDDDVMTTVTRRQSKTAKRSWQPWSSSQLWPSFFSHTPSTSSSHSTPIPPLTKPCPPWRRSWSSCTWPCCRISRWSATLWSTAFGCVVVRQMPPVPLWRRGRFTWILPARRWYSAVVQPRRQWQAWWPHRPAAAAAGRRVWHVSAAFTVNAGQTTTSRTLAPPSCRQSRGYFLLLGNCGCC